MSFSKSDLFAALKPKTQNVEVEGLGEITLQQLTVGESDAMRVGLDKDDKTSAFGLRLLGASLVDDTGARMLTDEEVSDMKNSSGVMVDKLVDAVLILNGYKKADAAKK